MREYEKSISSISIHTGKVNEAKLKINMETNPDSGQIKKKSSGTVEKLRTDQTTLTPNVNEIGEELKVTKKSNVELTTSKQFKGDKNIFGDKQTKMNPCDKMQWNWKQTLNTSEDETHEMQKIDVISQQKKIWYC